MTDFSAERPAAADAQLERHLRCLACGGSVEKILVALGSLRCLSCREADATLDGALVPWAHAVGGQTA